MVTVMFTDQTASDYPEIRIKDGTLFTGNMAISLENVERIMSRGNVLEVLPNNYTSKPTDEDLYLDSLDERQPTEEDCWDGDDSHQE